jgi:hypothetical protein
MVQVTLKAKEFLLIAYTLLNESSNQSFSLLQRIKDAVDGVGDDDLVSINTNEAEVEYVYRKLTLSPEGIFNEPNTSMFQQLQVQIQTGISAGNQEWIFIGDKLTAIRIENLSKANQYINYAKQKLA